MAEVPTLVLVHSPLVGPDTWGPVAQVLRDRDRGVCVPTLADPATAPHAARQIASVVDAAVAAGTGRVIVVVHSGAGALAPGIGVALRDADVEVAGYVLADAGLPTGGLSRFEAYPEVAGRVRDLLASGGRFPAWGDDDLAPLVPDEQRRRTLIRGLRPQPLSYWEEPIPAGSSHWPDAPVAVIALSDGYAATEERAGVEGWPVEVLARDNHFLALAEPERVATAIAELTAGW